MSSWGNHDKFNLPVFTHSGLGEGLKQCAGEGEPATVVCVPLALREDGEDVGRRGLSQQSGDHFTGEGKGRKEKRGRGEQKREGRGEGEGEWGGKEGGEMENGEGKREERREGKGRERGMKLLMSSEQTSTHLVIFWRAFRSGCSCGW